MRMSFTDLRLIFLLAFWGTAGLGVVQAEAQNICGNAAPELLQKVAHLERPLTLVYHPEGPGSELQSCSFQTHELDGLKEILGSITVNMQSSELNVSEITDEIPHPYGLTCIFDDFFAPAKALWCRREFTYSLFLNNRGKVSQVALSLPAKRGAELRNTAIAIAKATVLVIAPAKPLLAPPTKGTVITKQPIQRGLWQLEVFTDFHLIGNGQIRKIADEVSCSTTDGGLALTGQFFPQIEFCSNLRVIQLSPSWEKIYALCPHRIGEYRPVDVEINIIVDSPDHFEYDKSEESQSQFPEDGHERILATYKGSDCGKLAGLPGLYPAQIMQ